MRYVPEDKTLKLLFVFTELKLFWLWENYFHTRFFFSSPSLREGLYLSFSSRMYDDKVIFRL
jgi:hypothetical protein